MNKITYVPLEKINVTKPVDRIKYISNLCIDKSVLDIGAYDETAYFSKRNKGTWLHEEIAKKANKVIGIDSSELLKGELVTSKNSKIIKLNLFEIDHFFVSKYKVDIIVAGELIEHIFSVDSFLKKIKELYPKKTLILSTPNATSLYNITLGIFKRESCHKDHVHVFSYKTLLTICRIDGFKKIKIIPCHVKYTEMIANSCGFKKILILFFEKITNIIENLFPMLSGGYIVILKN